MVRGVYIHIPFCHQICNYCDFNKVFFKNQPVDQYLDALKKEMELTVDRHSESFQNIETIFIGGGTPTALSTEQLTHLFQAIQTTIPTNQIKEFTVEANPDELTTDKLQVLFEYGVNRLSLGVQSFNEQLLQQLGRTHSNNHVFQTIEDAKTIGFRNISIDLMYGLPNQTMEDWKETLKIALDLQLPHYSCYSLIVEPKTIFYIQYAKGKLSLPTEDLEAEMYDYLMNEMEKNSLNQYEISNFSKIGYHSIHNKIYWDNDEYAGFGAGAHGYMNGIRYSNIGPIKKYIHAVKEQSLPIFHQHEVSLNEKCEEFMYLGLRKNEGVKYADFEKRYGISMKQIYADVIQKLVNEQLLLEDEEGIKLSRRGRFVGNDVFQQFLL